MKIKDTFCNANYDFIMFIIKFICRMCSYSKPFPRPFLTRAFEVIQSGSTFTLQIVGILSAQPGAPPSKQPDEKIWRLWCSLKLQVSDTQHWELGKRRAQGRVTYPDKPDQTALMIWWVQVLQQDQLPKYFWKKHLNHFLSYLC